VLLVHGTFVNGSETFGWNYLPELAARGYRVCTVDLPNRSMSDIQVAAESVVVAVHRLARESGRKVDVIGHSQGALQVRWATRWWPSVQAEVDDVVTLAGPNQGTTVAALPGTRLGGCPACLQMAPGSAFLAALNAGDQTPGPVSYTSIYSTFVDELITPNATAARIEGASNLQLQALCPGRPVTHVTILVDAVAATLVLDALGRPGPATAARFNPAACRLVGSIGLPGTMGGLQVLLSPHPVPVVGTMPAVEPALKPYARPPVAERVAASPAASTATTSSPASTATTARPAVQPVASRALTTHAVSAAPVRAGMPATATGLAPSRVASSEPVGAGAVRVLAVLALVLTMGAVGGVAARRARIRVP
jgi:hypothetical protein